MVDFYEVQVEFLSSLVKIFNDLDKAYIVLFVIKKIYGENYKWKRNYNPSYKPSEKKRVQLELFKRILNTFSDKINTLSPSKIPRSIK